MPGKGLDLFQGRGRKCPDQVSLRGYAGPSGRVRQVESNACMQRHIGQVVFGVAAAGQDREKLLPGLLVDPTAGIAGS